MGGAVSLALLDVRGTYQVAIVVLAMFMRTVLPPSTHSTRVRKNAFTGALK